VDSSPKRQKEVTAMKTGRMFVGGAVAAFLIAMGAMALARGPAGSPLPAPTVSTSEVEASVSPSPSPSPTATAGVDISGPCDEAEHANDPRCVGVQIPAGGAQVGGVDISGPCDEAEHANDPRCINPGLEEDNSGPSGDDQDDDRSGPSGDGEDEDNSGPSENSGPGNSDDD
jgi:hypothetical protein